jgi:hypothetical protein
MDDTSLSIYANGVISVCYPVAYSINSVTLLVSRWHLAVRLQLDGGSLSVDIRETLVRPAILGASCADSQGAKDCLKHRLHCEVAQVLDVIVCAVVFVTPGRKLVFECANPRTVQWSTKPSGVYWIECIH